MTKQTGIIITIVVAVLTLCCSTTCCGSGIFTIVDQGETVDIDVDPYVAGVPVICLGVLVWVVPLLTGLFLVYKKNEEA